jgi:peptidoglycan/xylan/chitin deacetylase (PgdA/CDA1 family)
MANIKKYIRKLVGVVFYFSGAAIITRGIVCRNKVTILVYHRPDPDVLKKHIRYLKKRFHFIAMDELVHAIKNNDWTVIPSKALVLTFDDGYMGNYDLISLFSDRGIIPTIYLCSHVVNTHRHFWFESAQADITNMKRSSFAQLLNFLKVTRNYQLDKEYTERQALNYEEMKAMMKGVDFQSHTKYHPILTRCEPLEAIAEISESKKELEELLSKKIDHFSYPNGDYSEREIQEVIRSGYESARTLDVGWNYQKTDPYKLKAMAIEDNASLFILCAQVHGLFGYLKYAFYGSFKGLRPPLIT